MQHAYSAAASVEQFAKDVILPGMQAARTASITMDMSGSESSEQDSEDQGHKVFVATLLALREILAMNASRIFGIEEHCRKGEDTCSNASGSGSGNGNSRSSTKQKRKASDVHTSGGEGNKQSERHVMHIRSLATSVILNGISRLSDQHKNVVLPKFLTALVKYDGIDEEFSSCLERMDNRSIAVMPDGKVMKKTQNLACIVSQSKLRRI